MAKNILKSLSKKRPPYFWWILAHLLAVCFCSLSWFLTLYIFNNPELPNNYRILQKLNRAPLPFDFNELTVPAGNSLTPQEIYKKYAALGSGDKATEEKRQKLNKRMLRAYLESYSDGQTPTYIEGSYLVREVRPLTDKDLFFPGIAVRLEAMAKSDPLRGETPYPVIIEYLYSTENKTAFTWYKPGDQFTIKKIPNCAAILHIDHLGTRDEPIVNLTVVQIAYPVTVIGTNRSFSTLPPKNINLSCKFPLFDGKIVEQTE